MELSVLVYLDGEYLPRDEARVPIDDRGFLFADGVYEVARVYEGRPFLLDRHLERMRNGLRALRIPFEGTAELADVSERLLDENGLREGDAAIYVQITRGAAPRSHPFPGTGVRPTVFVSARPFEQHPEAYYKEGVPAITVADDRWARCDIKSIALLPNVLASQRAKEADAFEALFVRDGAVIEGAHSNLFAVYDGTLLTYPACNYILNGITRRRTLEIADARGLPARTGPILEQQLFDADELFLSGTTTEIMPITRVDGRPVGGGEAGPVTLDIQEAYRDGYRS